MYMCQGGSKSSWHQRQPPPQLSGSVLAIAAAIPTLWIGKEEKGAKLEVWRKWWAKESSTPYPTTLLSFTLLSSSALFLSLNPENGRRKSKQFNSKRPNVGML